MLVIAAFAGAVALGLLAIGPSVMTALLGDKGFHYGRVGLALVGLGMGLHLISGTLNQAALARGPRRAGRGRAGCSRRRCSSLFVAAHAISNEVTRVEVAYFTADAGPVRPAVGGLPAGWRRRPARGAGVTDAAQRPDSAGSLAGGRSAAPGSAGWLDRRDPLKRGR